MAFVSPAAFLVAGVRFAGIMLVASVLEDLSLSLSFISPQARAGKSPCLKPAGDLAVSLKNTENQWHCEGGCGPHQVMRGVGRWVVTRTGLKLLKLWF